MSLALPVVKVPAASWLCGKSHSPVMCLAYSRGANGPPRPPLLYPPATPTEIFKSAHALIEFSLAMRDATDVGGMSERDGRMSHDSATTAQT